MEPVEGAEVQIASRSEAVPRCAEIRSWVASALDGERDDAELTVRIVDLEEGAALNRTYRGRSTATNVLSFPAELPSAVAAEVALLGDVVVCAPVVEREAHEQGKPVRAHYAHMVVHGTLHLLGYDHVDDAEASVMEAKERDVLASLGIADPYLGEGTRSVP